MRASVRRSAQALLDGTDMVTMLAGAVSGAVTGYTYYPAGFDTDLRLAATGAVARSAEPSSSPRSPTRYSPRCAAASPRPTPPRCAPPPKPA
ncbi:hypothetical protein ACIRS3_35045 [Streptomyces virginiae]|uniref:hypothetical protein n=1 Tax=Streptomyces virginiae TaxID=1961 RepID=UPI0038029378